jgi:hypothetical protein
MNSKTKNINAETILNTKPRNFQAILQLLQFLSTLTADKQKHNLNFTGYRESRKSFDYVDAITNLMVRTDEVVAAVTCVGGPIISLSPTSEIHAQVRPKYTSYVW